jgi:predicted MPP superfamily phosphohydrolase
MRNSGLVWIIAGIMIMLDIYVYQAVKVVLPTSSPRLRMAIIIAYWVIAVVSIIMVISIPYSKMETWPKLLRTYLFAAVVGLLFSKLIASLFFAIDDVRRGGTWVVNQFSAKPVTSEVGQSDGISRSAFLSWAGLIMGGGLFSTLLYGFNNKYRYYVNRLRLSFQNLPEAFKGLKIVHISDIHSGSFTDKHAVQRGVDKILKENPDLILFTGDLVNDRASEMTEYMEIFSQLKAPLGVYSVLGNHDYGDYVAWESREAKIANLERLKEVHKELGWRLLMNEHVVLEKETDKIALLGIENWSGKGNFGRYGKMNMAHPGTESYPFKILMSHDPSHWDAEVRKLYPDIDLMLSGHTHGMQFGLEMPGFKWSPVQYFYKQWAGLYETDNQKLYVNRGYGFIGYPGRVGILPEISVIELSKA